MIEWCGGGGRMVGVAGWWEWVWVAVIRIAPSIPAVAGTDPGSPARPKLLQPSSDPSRST